MRSNTSILFRALIMGTAVGLSYTTANAVLPDDRWVALRVHETPNDPESALVFVVWLELTAMDSDGDDVGWDIITAKFIQPGTPDTTWTDNSPYVDTADGLWWIEHADHEAPLDSEFVLPPWLAGTATADDPLDDDLDYDFAGVTYTAPSPPGEPPYANTGALDYSFTLTLEQTPMEEGEDEPVDIPDNPGEPG